MNYNKQKLKYKEWLGITLDAITATKFWCPYDWREAELQRYWNILHDFFKDINFDDRRYHSSKEKTKNDA